jgi:hypothetical protein
MLQGWLQCFSNSQWSLLSSLRVVLLWETPSPDVCRLQYIHKGRLVLHVRRKSLSSWLQTVLLVCEAPYRSHQPLQRGPLYAPRMRLVLRCDARKSLLKSIRLHKCYELQSQWKSPGKDGRRRRLWRLSEIVRGVSGKRSRCWRVGWWLWAWRVPTKKITPSVI